MPLGGCQLRDSVKADVASELKEIGHCRLAGLFSILSVVGTSLILNVQCPEACKIHLSQRLRMKGRNEEELELPSLRNLCYEFMKQSVSTKSVHLCQYKHS